MTTLLWIRCKITYRILVELGWWRSLFVVGLLLFGFFKLFTEIDANLLLGGWIVLVFSIHATRTDKNFLAQTAIPVPYLFLIEYLLISLPILIYFIVNQQFIHFFISLNLLIAVAFTRFTIQLKQLQSFSFTFIPPYLFEWRAGLRQSWSFLLLIYVIAFALSQNETMLIFCLIILIAYFSTFCQHSESLVLVQLSYTRPQTFLLSKVFAHVFWVIVFLSPLLTLFFIYHPHLWLIGLIILIISISNQAFAVFQKYASWQANLPLPQNAVLNMFFLFSFVIPFLIPVGVFMLIRAYRKAITNLSLII
ncbi:MAG: hypothetical protein MUE81_17735 [Thermoflexibacter sp.]|jgi:hypothetical protein|nr:hypothetical protein [Thermoflexibacter sp.]